MAVWSDPLLPPIQIPLDIKDKWWRLGSARFQLLPQQFAFLDAQEEFVGYLSGVGGGKTRCGAIKSAFLSMIPENRGLVGRFALPDLEDTAQRDLLDFLHEAELLKDAPNAKNKRALVYCIDPITQASLGYTSEISFQHLDDPDHLRGRHLGWFWIDEGSELGTNKAWTVLVGRLRHPAAKYRYKGMVTGNPRGRNWIYDFFFNEELLTKASCSGRPGHHLPDCKFTDRECNRRVRLKRRAIHSRSYDNYFLPDDYIENIVASYSDEARRRDVEAEFDVFEGQIFKEFRHDVHVFEPPPDWTDGIPPSEWRRLLAVDVGGATPWAFIWCAVDPFGNLIMYDEIYEATTNVDHLAELALPKMVNPDKKPYEFQAKVIDYENKIAAEDLRKRGIAFTNARKINKSGDGGSVSLLAAYLHPNPKNGFPEWHHYRGMPNAPRMFITHRCPNLIRELPNQQWDQQGASENFRDIMDRKIPNHATDCCLYLVREMPHPAVLPLNTGRIVTAKSLMSQMYWEDVKRQEAKRGRKPEGDESAVRRRRFRFHDMVRTLNDS